eukprot:10598367-Alexandrium_andersonii.AAC.1
MNTGNVHARGQPLAQQQTGRRLRDGRRRREAIQLVLALRTEAFEQSGRRRINPGSGAAFLIFRAAERNERKL